MTATPTALICLDLDGTSVESDGVHAWFSQVVARQINEAVRRGAAWCTNSGRSTDNQLGMIQACHTLETLPVAILSAERFIHDVRPGPSVLRPRQPHNDLAARTSRALLRRLNAARAPLFGAVEAKFDRAERYPGEDVMAWLVPSRTEAARFAGLLRTSLEGVPDVQVLRNGQWVVVTHADFGKGKLLTTVAADLGLPRDRVLAVGDQPNDLDMLNGQPAAYVGCPADADEEAKATVRQANGWIAREPGPAGTAALIRRFVEQVLG